MYSLMKERQKMTDKQFLNWIADRLVFVHGDPASSDFVKKVRAIGDASGPGPAAIPRMGEFHPVPFGLKCFAGVFTALAVVLLVWGALSI